MKISERTISAVGKVITGDGGISPYRSGPDLVKFFNELGSNDVYASGFPSRWYYAEGKVRELNGTANLAEVFHSVLDPRDYLDTKFSTDAVAEHLNQYLKYDGYELIKQGRTYALRETSGASVSLDPASEMLSKVTFAFVEEQVKKCDQKIFEGDFAGAITNSRTLLEAVFLEVEHQLTGTQGTYDGDLPKLSHRVQRLLDLDPGRKDISDAQRQVLSGLVSVVIGVATLRNKMSDAHATNYVAAKRHAKLAVNAAKTVADFVLDVFLEKSGHAFESKTRSSGT